MHKHPAHSSSRENEEIFSAANAREEAGSIVCAADECYALPLAVMLESMAANLDPEFSLCVSVIDCGLSARSRERLGGITRSNIRLRWCEAKRSKELANPRWGHVSGATYERLMLEEHLPDGTDWALWLDCDLLVLGDIAPLLREAKASDSVVLAVRDPLISTVSSTFGVRDWQQMGLSQRSPYFNAGLMLINIERWRELEVARRAMDYLIRHGRHVFFNEQEALNAVLAGRWSMLDDRWNISANPLHARHQRPGGSGPAVLHFCGRIKPWKMPDLGGVQTQYFYHLDNTHWRGTRPRRSISRRIVSGYVRSNLRYITYPLENLHLRLCHYLGVRS